MLVYVAHPYNNLASNKKSVELTIKELALKNPNRVYISPIHSFGFLYTVVSYDKGMFYCLSLLDECDSAIFCKGWGESKGCRLEMEFCIENKIPWEEI